MTSADTIFALSTVRGVSAVAVVRLSGPQARNAGEAMCGELPDPWTGALKSIRDPASGEALDRGLVFWFPEGRSFTGEASVELHLHGSLAVIDSVLMALGALPGCRAAEPGEFTYRALKSGRLDLPAVEGLGDLLAAVTADQRRQAQRSGETRDLAEKLRAGLLESLAYLEASIDFSDEDIPPSLWSEINEALARSRDILLAELQGYPAAQRVRDGLEVAIVGPPNIGKSTLLNRLAGREAAITSKIAGTTRDVIEVQLDVDGKLVTLLDTAGLRETSDEVEAIGVERAVDRANRADIRVFLMQDVGELPEYVPRKPQDIVVSGKGDLTGQGISGLTGLGVDDLFEQLKAGVNALTAQASSVGNQRQAGAMEQALAALKDAISAPSEAEIMSHHVRRAIAALDSLVGRVDVEDVLGEIFSTFCIGK